MVCNTLPLKKLFKSTKELIPNKEFYRGVYKLYDKWYKYKVKQKLEIILEKNDLSKTPGYYDIIK